MSVCFSYVIKKKKKTWIRREAVTLLEIYGPEMEASFLQMSQSELGLIQMKPDDR